MSKKSYSPLVFYKSILRTASDFIADLRTTTPASGLEYFSFDSRMEEAELPKIDLLGVAGWTFNDAGSGLVNVAFGLTVSTISDINLMREAAIVSRLYELAGVGDALPVRDPTTGAQINELVITDFDIGVPGMSEIRNYRPVKFEALLGRPANG